MATIDTSNPDYFSLLRQYWGYPVFRDHQEEIIQAIHQGQDVMAILPTGSGKSVTFQIPALLCPGTALVVSPLIALMNDQVKSLKDKGIHAATWHGGMNRHELDLLIEDLYSHKTKLLYFSPERIDNPLFQKVIGEIAISFLTVDEAHCISQWGHDFRPAYRKISALTELIPKLQVVALTATATPTVEQDIITNLNLKNPLKIRSSVARENLKYAVVRTDDVYSVLPKVVLPESSQIIYFRSRKMTEQMQMFLQYRSFKSEAYHAGLTYDRREEVTKNWMNNSTPIICSTTAFGMGIDKPDVRRIIHFHLPESLEAYVQETGRAGRDGKKSDALLIFSKQNVDFTLKQLQISFPTVAYVKNVYKRLAHYSDLAVGSPGVTFPFDIAEFSTKYHLNARLVINSLQHLEWSGYIISTEGFYKPSNLYVTSKKHDLYDSNLSEDETQAMQSMLRLYEGIMQYPQTITEAKIAENAGIHEQDIRKLLLALHQKNLVVYRPASDLPTIQFTTDRLRSNDLDINEERIRFLKQLKTDQLQHMIAFARTDQCRTQFIALYFGDQIPQCGICDNCLSKKNRPHKSLQDEIQALLSNNEFTLEEFISKFPNFEKDQVIRCLQALEEENQIEIRNRKIQWNS